MPEIRAYGIAGMRLEVAPPRQDLDVLLPAAFEAFSAAPVPGEPSLLVRLEEDGEMARDPSASFLPHRFELRDDGAGYSFVNLHEEEIELGAVFPERREAFLRLPPVPHDWSDPGTAAAVSMGLSDFLKACLQVLLLERSGTLLHASGVERAGRGFAFLGPSGAGKSTAAGLLGKVPGAVVLNDDLVAVCLEEGGAVVCATPWIGSKKGECSPGQAPLSCVFVLSREGRCGVFRCARLDEKEALKRLLANLPWLGESERLNGLTVSRAARLAAAVPYVSLDYALSDDLWGRVEEALGR